MPMGRPSTYDPDLVQQVGKYFEEYEPWREVDGKKIPNPPPSKIDLVRYLRHSGFAISRSAVWDWEKLHPDFGNAIKTGIEQVYSDVLQENAMLGLWNTAFSCFSAKNRMGWRDQQTVEHTFHEPLLIKAMDGKAIETLKHG